jgi:DNA-binding MarR family transcriptional regulator
MATIVLDAVIELRRALSRAAATLFSGEISTRQAAMLRELRASGPLSQVALARATASDPAFVVRLLDDLEERGLVNRSRSETDRRQMVVSLTADGRHALRPLDAVFGQLEHAAGGALTREERATFVALTRKVTRSLGAVLPGADTAEGPRVQR